MLCKGNFKNGVLECVENLRWLQLQAGQDADEPSGFVLESTDGTTITQNYFWMDQNQNFRTSTSKPADEDGDGSVIAGAANAGANTTLSNLATTLVNADIILTDNIDIHFGTGSDFIMFSDGTNLDLDAASANACFYIGSNTVTDMQITGAASEVTWDGSADTLTLMDDAVLAFGDADDFTLTFDATYLDLDAAAANGIFNIGKTVDTDVLFHGGTPGSDILWDSSADDLIFYDDVHIAFGDGSDMYLNFNATDLELRQTAAGTGNFKIGVDNAGIDCTWFAETTGDYMKWDQDGNSNLGALIFEDSAIQFVGAAPTYTFAISTSAMLLDATDDANSVLILGSSGTHGLDVTFQAATASDFIKWDAASATFTFTDSDLVMQDADYILFGSASGGDISVNYEGTGNTLDFEQVTDATGAVDFIDLPVLMTGANSAGTLLTIAGIDTTGNSDTVSITHSGTGAGIKVACNEVDSVAGEFCAFAAQTTSVVWIDGGTTGDWDGADNVGMLHLSQDTPHIHAGASMLNITNSGQNITAAEGSCARFLDTGTARASTYGVEIHSTNNCGLHLTGGATGSSQALVTPYAAQTVSSLRVGAGADWDGADNIGMVHFNSDTALVHAGATNLYVGHATAQPITAAEGFLARFIDTGTARTNAYGVEIAVTATTGALNVSSGHSLFADKVTCSAGVQAASVAVIGTADGLTTGTIADGTTHCTVTVATNADDIVVLPTPTPGNVVWLHSSTVAYELRSSAPNTVLINHGAGGAAVESAVLNTDVLTRCVCTDATHWICSHFTNAGVESAADAAT